ncbi:hypothetical protein HDV06_005970 [Boothiomyces sp. JEL0866]|nr:hypothetical protein HDV06_005970 [Boothiomyces sp. JEL0866]
MSNDEAARKLLPSVDPSFFKSPHAWESEEITEDNPKARQKSPQRKPKNGPKKGKHKDPPSIIDRLGEKPPHHDREKEEKKYKKVEYKEEERYHKAPLQEGKKSVFDRLGPKPQANTTDSPIVIKKPERNHTHTTKPSVFDRLGNKPKTNTLNEAESNMDMGSRAIVKGKKLAPTVNVKAPPWFTTRLALEIESHGVSISKLGIKRIIKAA